MAEKIIVLDLENGVYVSDNVANKSYHSSKITSLLFDGEKATPTFKSGWYQVKDVPGKVQRKTPDKQINVRYELKSGYPETELTPKVVLENVYDEDSAYHEVSGLYQRLYDTEEGKLEDVECEFVVYKGGKFIKEQFKVEYNLLDQIQTPDALHPNKPCRLSGEEFYKVIREFIKKHIDGKYARITSDYDFCLTVSKVIDLAEPVKQKITVGTKRKPIDSFKLITNTTIKVFESAPKIYNSYPVQQPISAENYEALEVKINDYLSELIEMINEPVKQCECCKGRGVTINQ